MNIKQRGQLGAYLLSCGCRLGCCRHSHQLGSEVRLQPYLTSLPTLTEILFLSGYYFITTFASVISETLK